MAERHGGTGGRATAICLLMIALISTSLLASSGSAQDEQGVYELGVQTWELPDSHKIFINEVPDIEEPTEFITSLIRNYPDSSDPTGSSSFGPQDSTIVDIYSVPATDTVNISANMSVEIYASLATGYNRNTATTCQILGQTTTFNIAISVGGNNIFSEQIQAGVMLNTVAEIELYSTEIIDTEILIKEGDQFRLTISVEHLCGTSRGQIWWGGLDTQSGIVIEGDLLKPDLSVDVDDNGYPHIQFIPYSPWGMDDYDLIDLHIWGPLDDDEGDTGSMDLHIEHFDTPHGTSIVEGNRTALTWFGKSQLTPGHHLLKSCIRTSDMSTWDTSSQDARMCPDEEKMSGVTVTYIQSTTRFGVDNSGEGGFNSMIIFGIWFLILIGWVFNSLRIGDLPWPIMALALGLVISSIGIATSLPTLNSEFERSDGPAPNFILLTHGGGSTSLTDLLEDKDALVLGVFQSNSPNSIQQYNEFKEVLEERGDSISVAQLVTGKNVQMVNLDEYSNNILNKSWPLMIDESNSGVAKQFPTGSGDAVIIIDKAGTVSWSKAGSAGDDEIISGLDKLKSGSQQSIGNLFGIIWILLWPMMILGMPRSDETDPDNALFPGSKWGGTIFTAGIGSFIWFIPVTLLALSPLKIGSWYWIELGLTTYFLWTALSCIKWGAPPEFNMISNQIYKRLPSDYTSYKNIDEFQTEMRLGLWFAWLSWIVYPMLIPQGVSAVMLNGIGGIFSGLIFLVQLFVCAGVIILLARILAKIGGRFSTIFGKLSAKDISTFWGLMLTPLSIWLMIQSLIYIISSN